MGKKITLESGEILYENYEDLTEPYLYYVIAGMVKTEHKLPGKEKLKYYYQPGTIFGMEEAVHGRRRFSKCVTLEKTMVYRWKLNDFLMAADEIRKLAVIAIRGLSRLLRILNAEYGEQVEQLIDLSSDTDDIQDIKLNLEYTASRESHSHLKHSFKDKELIIKEGMLQKQIFLILNGEVMVTRNIGGKQKILAKLGKGELIGEMSLFDMALTSANVVASGEVQALIFNRRDFKETFFANPKWTERLLFSLSNRIISMVSKLSTMDSSVKIA